MIREVFDLCSKEYSGERAKLVVSQIVNFHRIQASPGYRAAAERVKSLLSEAGLDSEIFNYPAREGVSFWNYSSFQESIVNDARLYLITKKGEEKIADYNDNKLSVIQRSISSPPEGVEADLVILDKGETEEEYKDVKVKGKIVLASGDINHVYSLAVEKFGAIGILSDKMAEWPPVREKIDLPDALQYTSFWWYPKRKRCFGFVVSPRTGMKIRAQAKKEPLKVKAYVSSNIYDGNIEVVSAKIPGEIDKEILVTAHLCHPQPSANDNASGVGALVEAARILNGLIKDGKLKKPQRTIRFLFVPEMTGTFAFLSNNEKKLQNFVAGINLDMVGEDQKLCGSILMVDSTPYSFPSFVNAYIKYLFEFLPKEIKTLSDSENISNFRYEFVKFSGGSDHGIMSDPSVGIPAPSFTNWPDKYYHTSEDTLEKVSPKTLWNVGVIATTFAYTMAYFNRDDFNLQAILTERYCEEKIEHIYNETIREISNSTSSDFKKKVNQQLIRWNSHTEFWSMWLTNAILDLKRLDQSNELEKIVSFFSDKFRTFINLKNSILEEYIIEQGRKYGASEIRPQKKIVTELRRKASKMLPSRIKPGPVDIRLKSSLLNEEDKKKLNELQRRPHSRILPQLALYWTNGERSISEIAEKIEIEMDHCNLSELIEWFLILEKMKLVKIQYI